MANPMANPMAAQSRTLGELGAAGRFAGTSGWILITDSPAPGRTLPVPVPGLGDGDAVLPGVDCEPGVRWFSTL